MGQHQAWLLLQRPPDRLLRLIEPFLLDADLTQLEEKSRLIDLSLERVSDHGLGASRVSLAHPQIGQLPQNLSVPGIERTSPFEADQRFIEAAFVLVGDGEAEQRVLVFVVSRERGAIGGNRVLGAVHLLVDVAEHHA